MANTEDRVLLEQMEEESYDTSEPKEVNKAKKRAARTRVDRLEFVEAAMTTQQGRAWFYDTLVRCRVFNTPFQDDPYRTAFNCGMNNIGLQILDDIQMSAPDEYITMLKENKSKNV